MRSTATSGCAAQFRRRRQARGSQTQPPTPGAHEIALVTARGVAGFWGDPLIVDRGAGRPTPNVLFIVIDTLRVDALPAMPRLRALAKQGAR